MYKIVTEKNEIYTYITSDNLKVVCINIPEDNETKLQYLANAANYRFGQDNHYLNKTLASLGVLQAESLKHTYKDGDYTLPCYLKLVKQMEGENIFNYNKPKNLVGVS